MHQQDWFLILNPASGSGNGGRSWQSIKDELVKQEISFSLYTTTGPGDACKAVISAIGIGFRKILVVGGDGSLSEAANGILDQTTVHSSEILLALIPVGTGNDWGRTWKLPSSVKERIALLKTPHICRQDAGRVIYNNDGITETRWFMNIAGCGFDAQVTVEANKAKAAGKSGVMVYISKLVSTLFSYKPVVSSIWIDGKQEQADLFAMLAGIGRFGGNKMLLAPEANPTDGLFDVLIIRKISRLKVIFHLPKLFNGKLLKLSEISQKRCSSVRIESNLPLFLQMDGESVGKTPVEMTVFPGALSVVTGTENPFSKK